MMYFLIQLVTRNKEKWQKKKKNHTEYDQIYLSCSQKFCLQNSLATSNTSPNNNYNLITATALIQLICFLIVLLTGLDLLGPSLQIFLSTKGNIIMKNVKL